MKMNPFALTALSLAVASLCAQAQPIADEPSTQNDVVEAFAADHHSFAKAAAVWAEGNTYTVGTVVSYNGQLYTALVTHTAFVGANWNPAATPSLWKAGGTDTGGGGGGGTGGTAGITSGATYKLTNTNSGLVLDVSGCGTNNGTNVQVWADGVGVCASGAGQAWTPTLNADGTYTIVNPNSSKALDVSGCGSANGTNVQIWANGVGVCNSGAGQKWRINANGDGTYTLVNPGSNKALNVNGAGTTNGTNVSLFDQNSGGAQKWRFATWTATNPGGGGSGGGGGGGNGTLTLAGAIKADQTKRIYTGYYPSYSDNYFDATGKDANAVYTVSKFAQIPANYTHVVVAFARPSMSWSGLAANSWGGTGIEFTAMPKDIKAAIDVLHQRNMKVILAIGGATYNDWGSLGAEGRAGGGPITTALTRIMTDMGFDGLDVDYEVDADVDLYANSIKAMRNAVNAAGNGRILTLAAWSTGADCTAATSTLPGCAGKLSYWGGNAGRERLLVARYPDAANSIDIVNVLTYDARFEHYDGVTAYNEYRGLFPSRAIVSIGYETAPEGYAGGLLVVNDVDAQCEGSRNLLNSYNVNINLPYSVERYGRAVLAAHPNRNPRDGAMLWQILKKGNGTCGSAAVASPGSVGRKVSNLFGLPDDPLLQTDVWR